MFIGTLESLELELRNNSALACGPYLVTSPGDIKVSADGTWSNLLSLGFVLSVSNIRGARSTLLTRLNLRVTFGGKITVWRKRMIHPRSKQREPGDFSASSHHPPFVETIFSVIQSKPQHRMYANTVEKIVMKYLNTVT